MSELKFAKQNRIVNLDLIAEVKRMPCVISRKTPVDVHHLISRKSGIGHDAHWNLIPLSREHHQEIHNIGKVEMAKKYYDFRLWLELKGWTFDHLFKKWVYRKNQTDFKNLLT